MPAWYHSIKLKHRDIALYTAGKWFPIYRFAQAMYQTTAEPLVTPRRLFWHHHNVDDASQLRNNNKYEYNIHEVETDTNVMYKHVRVTYENNLLIAK